MLVEVLPEFRTVQLTVLKLERLQAGGHHRGADGGIEDGGATPKKRCPRCVFYLVDLAVLFGLIVDVCRVLLAHFGAITMNASLSLLIWPHDVN